jgi:hypothetical protein
MHFWQLKTFWNETKVCDDDMEFLSFEEISTEPAQTIDQTDPSVRLAVAEMIRFKEEFEFIRNDPSIETDLASFWLRKTKKPVLAVLLVQKPGQKPKLYRGTNMEVSMPTGSLCAERNVIGSALADDLTLRRQDLKVIAVYSVGGIGVSETIDSNNDIKEEKYDDSYNSYNNCNEKNGTGNYGVNDNNNVNGSHDEEFNESLCIKGDAPKISPLYLNHLQQSLPPSTSSLPSSTLEDTSSTDSTSSLPSTSSSSLPSTLPPSPLVFPSNTMDTGYPPPLALPPGITEEASLARRMITTG